MYFSSVDSAVRGKSTAQLPFVPIRQFPGPLDLKFRPGPGPPLWSQFGLFWAWVTGGMVGPGGQIMAKYADFPSLVSRTVMGVGVDGCMCVAKHVDFQFPAVLPNTKEACRKRRSNLSRSLGR